MQQIYTTLPSPRFNVVYHDGEFYEFKSKQKMDQWMQAHPGSKGYSCNSKDMVELWKSSMRNPTQRNTPKDWRKMTPDQIRMQYPEMKVRQRKLKKDTKNCGNCVKYHPPEDVDTKCGTCGDRIVYDRSLARHCIGYQSKWEIQLFVKHEKQVRKLLGPDKTYIHMEGDPHNPTVHFHCKKCNEDHVMTWQNLQRGMGHDCAGVLSTGETLVKEWLEKHNLAFCTQYDTLKCINPDTGHQLPYDFQVTDHKLIIEVQGLQHEIFIPWFHVDEEGFVYQQKKDAYKKKYAEDHGYKVLEILQRDIQSGRYKQLLQAALHKES